MNHARRLNFFTGEFLGLREFQDEQKYLIDLYQNHNRYLHTWGIADGLTVYAGPGNLSVRIEPGMAVDEDGNEIILLAERVVSFPATIAAYYLTIQYASELAEPVSSGDQTNYKRIVAVPCISYQKDPPGAPPLQLILGQVDVDPSRAPIVYPDQRRYAGIAAGALRFSLPGTPPGEWPEITGIPAVASGRAGIRVRARVTEMAGDAILAQGKLSVGSDMGEARVTAAGVPILSGAGRIASSDGLRVVGDRTAFTVELNVGDSLLAIDAAGRPVQARVTRIFDDTNLETDQPLNCAGGEFSFQQALVARFAEASGAVALAVLPSGYTGVGTADPQDRLHVAGGDLHLENGYRVLFENTGEIRAVDRSHRLIFDAGNQLLEAREAGTIYFSAGSTSSAPETHFVELAPSGNVGMYHAGSDASLRPPPEKLTVDGVISSAGGFIFPDGTIQYTAAVSIPIGAVVDWWLPEGDNTPTPEGFMVCDGSRLPDKSPLRAYATNVPDLTAAFVKGASFANQNKRTGVATHVHPVTAPIPAHDHSIYHKHEDISGGETAANNGAYYTRMPKLSSTSGGWARQFHNHSSFQLSFPSVRPSPEDTDLYGPYTQNTEGFSSFPAFMRLLKIMRVI